MGERDVNISHLRRSEIIASVLRWYRRNGRSLPWRGERNPYRVLLSEVMLQQTQVARVLVKYPDFLRKYPTLARLARARSSALIKAWRGMGYNNRVLRLQALARTIVRDFGGSIPSDVTDLMGLPGIGRYTAHAVACFAFDQRLPVVDTNISRIFHRLFPHGRNAHRQEKPDPWVLAASLLPRSNAHDWNQALMDLGATICTASSPRCGACPLQTMCPSANKIEPGKPRRVMIEPSRKGIPNRIYRGKAIDILRDLRAGESIHTSLLARKIKKDYSRADQRWFFLLIKGLERDGLVCLRGKTKISLPD